eukprot:4821232-Amphidinium_carterae.1
MLGSKELLLKVSSTKGPPRRSPQGQQQSGQGNDPPKPHGQQEHRMIGNHLRKHKDPNKNDYIKKITAFL